MNDFDHLIRSILRVSPVLNLIVQNLKTVRPLFRLGFLNARHPSLIRSPARRDFLTVDDIIIRIETNNNQWAMSNVLRKLHQSLILATASAVIVVLIFIIFDHQDKIAEIQKQIRTTRRTTVLNPLVNDPVKLWEVRLHKLNHSGFLGLEISRRWFIRE